MKYSLEYNLLSKSEIRNQRHKLLGSGPMIWIFWIWLKKLK